MYSSDTKYLLKQAGIELHTRYPTSPISLKVFCKHFGLKYRKKPLDKNTCGMLIRSLKGNHCVINDGHPYTRRRFSLAHEVGHYFLGHESEVSRLNDNNRFEEIHANRYASSLLMPDELFHYVHKENITIKAMAQWLRVSPISVAIRCQQFGIRQYEAELTKSDYYFAIEESVSYVAAAREKESIKPKVEYEWRKQDQRMAAYETVMRENEETLDRLRRARGYE